MLSGMTVGYLNPRGTSPIEHEVYDLRLDPALVSPVIGILANGFIDSVAFAGYLGDAITAAQPGTRIVLENKGDPSTVVGGERLERMAAECNAVIGLYGH